jgi:hypothetical protein
MFTMFVDSTCGGGYVCVRPDSDQLLILRHRDQFPCDCVCSKTNKALSARIASACIHIYLHITDKISIAAAPVTDDLYLRIVVGCAHEQKAHGG